MSTLSDFFNPHHVPMDKAHVELTGRTMILKYGWHHVEIPIDHTLYNRAPWWRDDHHPKELSAQDIHQLIHRFGHALDWVQYGFNMHENYKYYLVDLAMMNHHDYHPSSVQGLELKMTVSSNTPQSRAYALITLDYMLHGCPITLHLHPLLSEGANRLSLSHHEYHGNVSLNIIYEQWETLKLINSFFNTVQCKIYPCRDKLKNYDLPLHDAFQLYPCIDVLQKDLTFFSHNSVMKQKHMIEYGFPKLLADLIEK